MKSSLTPDTFHRTAKALIDAQRFESVDAAIAHLNSLRLGITVGHEVGRSSTFQAALLTIVNCARRCFLGGVVVVGVEHLPLVVPVAGCRTLTEAIVALGGICNQTETTSAVQIQLGTATVPWRCPLLRPTFNGWSGGVLGLSTSQRLQEHLENSLTGVFIGALAVAEAFQMSTATNAVSGRRDVGLSLWDPSPETDWTVAEPGPELSYLPAQLWLIGLGHLGQAYLWTLGLLPYANPSDVHLVLQDFDSLVEANESTSPLTNQAVLGQLKTRVMSQWCEQRGFQSRVVERRFGSDLRVQEDEPRVALCGVDNAKARSLLEGAQFELVIEAGLGKGWNDYLDIQLHSFPSQIYAKNRWSGLDLGAQVIPAGRPYAQLAADGLDECGLLQLASRSVGASFVGCATAALVIGELVRVLHGGHRHALIDLSLRNLSYRRTVPAPSAGQYPGAFAAAKMESMV